MKLWVLRHGEAEPYGSRPDSERALTPHGCEEVLRSAAHLIGQPITAITPALTCVRSKLRSWCVKPSDSNRRSARSNG